MATRTKRVPRKPQAKIDQVPPPEPPPPPEPFPEEPQAEAQAENVNDPVAAAMKAAGAEPAAQPLREPLPEIPQTSSLEVRRHLEVMQDRKQQSEKAMLERGLAMAPLSKVRGKFPRRVAVPKGTKVMPLEEIDSLRFQDKRGDIYALDQIARGRYSLRRVQRGR